jgi:hypothetical protein
LLYSKTPKYESPMVIEPKAAIVNRFMVSIIF